VALAAGLAATLERWWFARAWGEAGTLTSVFYYGDATRLVDYASAILQGRPFDNGIPFHPPGWPVLLAVFLRLTGDGAAGASALPVAAVKLFLAALGGASVALASALAFEIAGFGAMLAVALVGPFHFGHIVEGTVANSEALYGLLLVVTLQGAWRWLRPDGGSRPLWAAVAGAAAGGAMVVRAEFLAAAVLLVPIAWWADARDGDSPGARGRLRASALFAVAFIIVLAPTTVWHWRSLSAFNAAHVGRVAGPLPRFAPVTSYGPFNFAMANHENADGGPNRDHPLLDRCGAEGEAGLAAGELDLACPAVYDLYVNGYAIGRRWLVTHPAAALALLTSKLSLMSGFLAHGYLVDNVGAGVTGTRRRVDLLDPRGRALVWIHLALVLGGVVVLRRRPVALAVIASAVVALLASTLMFYGYVRLGVAYLPALWVLQGAALSALVQRGVTPKVARPRRAAGVTVAVLALLLVLEAAHLGDARRLAVEGVRTPGGAIVQDESVEIGFPGLSPVRK